LELLQGRNVDFIQVAKVLPGVQKKGAITFGAGLRIECAENKRKLRSTRDDGPQGMGCDEAEEKSFKARGSVCL